MIHIVVYALALLALTIGGNWACQLFLNLIGLKDATAANGEPPNLNIGRYIGAMERLLMAIGIGLQSWEIVAAVVALKSIARFKELDEKLSAEYFLIGSLFSILWAFLVTGACLFYDAGPGMKLVASLNTIFAAP